MIIKLVFIMAIVSLLSTVTLSESIFAEESNPTEYLNYQSPERGFSIQYPSDWISEELEGNFLMDMTRFRPSVEQNLEVPENVAIVMIQKTLVPNDLNEYNDLQMQEIPRDMENFKWIERNSTTLAGNPGYKVLFSSTVSELGTEKTTMIIWTIKNGKAYEVWLSTKTDNFSSYLPAFENMIESFKIIASESDSQGGGCLIATATYGSEMAPQVQFLREIRDNTVMSTSSGSVFMAGFNQMYYSFSPTIADLERENPLFQETVRVFITPMISTFSIMTLADDGSEIEVLGLGIFVIALNLGMYVVAPTIVSFKINRHLKSRKI